MSNYIVILVLARKLKLSLKSHLTSRPVQHHNEPQLR